MQWGDFLSGDKSTAASKTTRAHGRDDDDDDDDDDDEDDDDADGDEDNDEDGQPSPKRLRTKAKEALQRRQEREVSDCPRQYNPNRNQT